MKKSIVALFLLLHFFTNNYAVLTKLPVKFLLEKRLRHHNFGEFIENTNLVNRLADKQIETLGIVFAIEAVLCDYTSLNAAMPEEQLKDALYEAILDGANDNEIENN